MVKISQAEYQTNTSDEAAPTAGYEILYPFDDGSTTGRQWRVRDDTEVIIAILKHNYSATAAPTTGDDVGDGYGVGSIWVDTTNDNAYICEDNSSGAANWLTLNATGSIGGSTGATDNAILRADGTGGSTAQATGITVDDSDNISGAGLDADNNTVTNIGSSEVKAELITGLTADASPDGASDYVMSYDNSAGALKKVLMNDLPGGGGSSPPFDDNTAILQDSADNTKKLLMDVGNVTTSTTRTWTIQDSDDTFVGRATSDTFTNKTFDADGTGNTISNIGSSEVKAELITGLTADASPDGAADYVMTYDASGTALKKVLLDNLPAGAGGDTVTMGAADLGDITSTATTSTTGVDVTNSSFSATVGADGDIHVVYYNLRVVGATSEFCELRIVAGAVNGTWHPMVGNAVTVNPTFFGDVLSGVSSGSQTVKLQIRSSGGSSVSVDTNQGIANDVFATYVSK